MGRWPGVAGVAAVAALAWWWRRVETHIWVTDLNILNYDSYAYYYPTFRYAFARLAAGEFPWWNPYQLCGTPFFANAQHVLLYPLNFFYLVLPTASAMKWTAILHYALAEVFTFACARVFGLSMAGALTAAAAFAFSGSVVSLLYVPHHLYGAVWMPLVLALAELLWRARRPVRIGIALGVVLACQYLGGYPMYSLFSVYLVAGHLVWRLVGAATDGTGIRDCVRRVGATAIAGIVALALAAPQLLPAAELARQSPRAFGALGLAEADPVFGKPSPAWLLRGLVAPHDNEGFPVDGYVGLAALLAVAVAPLARRHRRVVVLFAAVAIVAWVLALGTSTPVYELYFHLPTGSWFRRPARFLVLACLAVAMLAGAGLDALRERARPTRIILFVSGALVLAVGTWQVHAFLGWRPILVAHLTAILVWTVAVAVLPPRAARGVAGLLPLVAYAELFRAFANLVPIPETDPHFDDMPPAIVDYLRTHAGYDRVYLLAPTLRIANIARLSAKIGMTHGLYMITDRENVYAERYQRYIARLEGTDRARGAPPQGEVHVTARAPNRRLLDLLGVRFVVDGPETDFLAGVPAERFPLRYEAAGLRVHENPDAFPRLLLARDVEVVSAPQRALDRLVEPGFDPRATVVLEEPPGVPSGAAGAATGAARAEIVSYEPETVVVRAALDAPAWLVLTDQAYPGWEARVDGQPARVYRADYLFRAVALGPGEHEVVFRFRPTFLRALVG